MIRTKKIRGDSKLKTLSPTQQKQIIQWLETGTREEAKAKIRDAFHIDTNTCSLSEFRSWYFLSRQLEEAKTFADDLKANLQAIPDINLNGAQLSQAAQLAFEMQALKENDKRLFLGLRLARNRDDRVNLLAKKTDLEERRIKLLEAKAAQLDSIEKVVSGAETPEEKQQKIRQIFGM